MSNNKINDAKAIGRDNVHIVGNRKDSIHDSLSILDWNKWRKTTGSGDIINLEEGNAAAAGFIRIAKSPMVVGETSVVTSNISVDMPLQASLGISMSQRVGGEAFVAEFVGVDKNGDVETTGATSVDKAISGDITVATNVWTINTTLDHELVAGDMIYLKGCQDSRLNVGLVQVTAIVTATQFTLTSTLANATYTVGASGSIEKFFKAGGATNQFGIIFDGTTTANARFNIRAGGGPSLVSASTAMSTNWTLPVVPSGYASPYTVATQPTAETQFLMRNNGIAITTAAVDSTSTPSQFKRSQTTPDSSKSYRFRVRAYGQDNRSMPVGKIVTSTKAGSTTATIVTDVNHGLTTSDFVLIYGNRDATNFANLTTATQVSSIVSPTSFTIAYGGSTTATTYGGFVIRVNGGNSTGIVNANIQSVSCLKEGELTVVFNATQGTHNVGDYMWIGGLYKNDGSGAFSTTGWTEGMYKIIKSDTATFNMILQVPGLSTFGSTNVGGAALKPTEFRLHWARVMDYQATNVEVVGGINHADGQSSVPVVITQNSATNQSVNVAQIGGTTVVTGGVSGIQAVGGNIAHGTATTANPVPTGGRVVPNTLSTIDTGLAAGDTSWKPITSGFQAVVKDFGTSELDFASSTKVVGTTVTVQQLAQASGQSSIRNYITSLQIQNDTLGAAGDLLILDGIISGTSVTIANPGVFTTPAHDLKIGDPIVFTSLGTITGISTNTVYYCTTIPNTTTFTVALTPGGTGIQITGVTSAFTCYRVFRIIRMQTTAGTLPPIPFPNPLRGTANLPINFLIPVSLTSGNVYLSVTGYRGF